MNRDRDADRRSWVVNNLDVVALYPSLDIETCVIVIARAMMGSDVVFRNLQWQEIVLYLRYNMDPDDRRSLVFECSGRNLDKGVRYETWIFPEAVPDEAEVRRMFSIAVGIMVRRDGTT